MEKAGTSRMTSSEAVTRSRMSPGSGGSDEKRSCVSNAFLSRKSFRLQRREDSIELNELEILTHHTWNICRVSPLNGFQETEARLKHYAMYLRGRFLALKVEEEVEYKSEVQVVKGCLKSENDLALKVEVRCRRKDEWKPIYVGLLLSWGSLNDNLPDTVHHLPILLYKGYVAVKQVVHDALQTLFDCIITQCFLTQDVLVWLNGVFVSACGPGEKGKTVKFDLTPPWKCDSRMEYKIILSDICKLWERIHSEDSDLLLREEEVLTFYNALVEHAHNQFKINMESFKVDQITYPKAGINVRGKLRCKSIELWDDILSFFYSDFELIDVNKMTAEESSGLI